MRPPSRAGGMEFGLVAPEGSVAGGELDRPPALPPERLPDLGGGRLLEVRDDVHRGGEVPRVLDVEDEAPKAEPAGLREESDGIGPRLFLQRAVPDGLQRDG